MQPPRVHLLGIPIDPVTQQQAVDRLLTLFEERGAHHVMTPNSEMLVEAHHNQQFAAVLRATSLNLPDSVGLLWMARLTGQRLPQRVTGIDTVTQLCRVLREEHPVFLLGGKPGIAEEAAQSLRETNSHLRIVGTFAGSPASADARGLIKQVNASGAHLLLVAFGAPRQDLWIAEHLAEFTSVRVAMGVGGTFDFLAGVLPRAPGVMQHLGLEWMWRLGQEPRRIQRIWRAVVVFPVLVLFLKRKRCAS